MAQKQAKGSKTATGRQQSAATPPRAPSRFSGKDILHVIIIGLVCTVIFAGIGIAVSMSKGIPTAQIVVNNNNATQVAVNGTAVPTIEPTATETEIPCEAQAWWDSISAPTAQVVNNLQTVSVAQPPSQRKANQQALQTWKTSLESATSLPPCVQPAQEALITAATESDTFYGAYDKVSTQPDRAQEYLLVMDKYLAVTNELNNLKVTVSEDWFKKVQDFTNGDCPARRWYIYQFIQRDYQRYFTVLQSINIRSMSASDLQQALLDLRTLGSSFKADSPNFPACVQDADAHYSASIDAAMQAVNAALNGNIGAVNDLLVTATSEKTAFQTGLKALDPTIFDPATQSL